MAKLSPVKLAIALAFFESYGWTQRGQKGSHITMTKAGNPRPLVIPAHKEVTIGVMQSNMRTAGLGRSDLMEFLKQEG